MANMTPKRAFLAVWRHFFRYDGSKIFAHCAMPICTTKKQRFTMKTLTLLFLYWKQHGASENFVYKKLYYMSIARIGRGGHYPIPYVVVPNRGFESCCSAKIKASREFDPKPRRITRENSAQFFIGKARLEC
ncbi:hypothetical protein O0880_27030 [Janthinobacterium sp. SUN118]|uniref:hypothetical protein n=1 Tax=Janthinobacterium sp. SUN118 TaxID=3004100 RepID=UPI0025B0A3A2|nr:hypothetical protein [Janthinobacterium sp. SUN118]MDN2713079.1 hypothetical protein [Janthinobacterium sp. SUN118]